MQSHNRRQDGRLRLPPIPIDHHLAQAMWEANPANEGRDFSVYWNRLSLNDQKTENTTAENFHNQIKILTNISPNAPFVRNLSTLTPGRQMFLMSELHRTAALRPAEQPQQPRPEPVSTTQAQIEPGCFGGLCRRMRGKSVHPRGNSVHPSGGAVPASKNTKTSSPWSSTRRKTTCKDGVARTVYRNRSTGALATRRVVKAGNKGDKGKGGGKRSVRYVKLV
jgi:hypothetical protein